MLHYCSRCPLDMHSIITKVGKSFSSRVCGSLLNYCKLELMVYNNNDYFNKALELAQNKELYTTIVKKIIKKKLGQFFDTEKYTKTLENAYKKVHNMRINKEEFRNVYIQNN